MDYVCEVIHLEFSIGWVLSTMDCLKAQIIISDWILKNEIN